MLVLSRCPGEALTIGDDIVVTIVEIQGRQVRVRIDAPAAVLKVLRLELLDRTSTAHPEPDAADG